MEAVFASADYLLLGSRYEGSGFALLEALACGVVPIATDIPSFNVMTDGGAVGALWPVGRPRELTRAVRRTLARRRDELSAAARALFERRLSWAAIGARAVRAYTELLRGATS
jgi:glycosyltransferase involved in cell wall biosynthesis